MKPVTKIAINYCCRSHFICITDKEFENLPSIYLFICLLCYQPLCRCWHNKGLKKTPLPVLLLFLSISGNFRGSRKILQATTSYNMIANHKATSFPARRHEKNSATSNSVLPCPPVMEHFSSRHPRNAVFCVPLGGDRYA